MRRLMRIASVGAIAVVVGGCSLPLPVSVATWALDGVSYVTTNKSLTDHGLSMIMGEDCAKHRFMTDDEICAKIPMVGPVLVEDTTLPSPEIEVAELYGASDGPESVDEGVVAPAAFALAALDTPPSADPMVAALEFPEDNFALAFADPANSSDETDSTAVALGGVDLITFETAAGPVEPIEQVTEVADATAAPLKNFELNDDVAPEEFAVDLRQNNALAQFEFADLAPVGSIEIETDATETPTVQAEVIDSPENIKVDPFDPAVYAPANFEPEAVQMAVNSKTLNVVEIASTAAIDIDLPNSSIPNYTFNTDGLPGVAFEPDAVQVPVSPDAGGGEVAAVQEFFTKIQSIFRAPDPDVTVAAAQSDGSLSEVQDRPDAERASDGGGYTGDGAILRFGHDLGPNMVPDQPPELG